MTGDLLKEVQLIWNVLWQEKKKSTFNTDDWLIVLTNNLTYSGLICFLWYTFSWINIQWDARWISVIVAKRHLSNFSAISSREQVYFQSDDDEICFVLDQHALLYQYSCTYKISMFTYFQYLSYSCVTCAVKMHILYKFLFR
jgi:hypothetical protein